MGFLPRASGNLEGAVVIRRLCIVAGLAALALGLLAPGPAAAGGLKLGKALKLSKKQEATIAKSMHDDLAKDPGLIEKGKDYELVQQVGKRIVEKNHLTQYDYKFFLVKQDEVNAFATPGGFIYVTAGLMKYMAYDPSMLAGVMAHEIGHAKDRHVVKNFEKQMQGAVGLGVLSVLLGKQHQDVTGAVGAAGGMALLKYSRDQEEWADRAGVELAYRAGYDAYGLPRSLECLNALYGSADPVGVWTSNHPATADRIKRTQGIAKSVSMKDQGYMPIPFAPKDSPLFPLYGKAAQAAKQAKPPQDEGQSGTGSAEKYKKGDKQTSPVRP